MKSLNPLLESHMNILCANYTTLDIAVHPIHGKPPKENLLATTIFQHQLHTLPKPQNKHVAAPTLHLHLPTYKGLHIVRHNKAIHRIAHTLQFNKHIRCYTPVNANNQHNQPNDITILKCSILCKCLPNICTCMDILCTWGPPIDNHTHIPPKPIKQHRIHRIHFLLW